MRRRLPAGLRWRLLLALLATSAVTLGVAALVVLPPMQDRLRNQSADSLEDSVVATRHNFQAVFTKLDKELEQPARDELAAARRVEVRGDVAPARLEVAEQRRP